MDISLDSYKTFYYVAKLSSITAAAEKLYISQPAVSQSVKQLEKLLGCSLFFRTKKGVTLTKEGEALYFHVASGYEQILLGERRLEEMLDFETGEVRIGANDMTLQYYLLPFLEAFHNKYPKVRMGIMNLTTPATIESLREGKIDLGVVGSPVENYKGLSVRDVAQIQDVFLAGERFRHLQGKRLSLGQIMQYPVVCHAKGTSTRQYLDEFFAGKGIELRPDFEVATSDLIAPFAERNMGIGIVVDFFAKESIRRKKAFVLETEEQLPPRKICVVTGNKGQVSHAAKEFIRTLK